MDMSKLPRLSQSPAPPPGDPDAGAESLVSHAPPATADPGIAPAPPPGYAMDPTTSFAEAWIGVAVGAILLLLSPRLLQYLFSPSTFPQKWTFSDATGAPMPYRGSVFFWGDLAIVTFALVMILEGLVIGFARKPAAVTALLSFTVLTVALNAVYVIAMLATGYGPQIMSALAVAFGVYIALYQWNLLKTLRLTRHRRRDNPPAAA